MEETTRTSATKTLPVILIAAVAQGWALYGLHQAIEGRHWPATHSGLLIGFYSAVLFLTLSIELLAEHTFRSSLWILVSLGTAAFFYFGWHHGSAVADLSVEHFVNSGECFPLAFVSIVLWLLLLPFLQVRLAAGRWTARYDALFASAWRNHVMLAEALLFTALFWLLLTLWQLLFKMLGIGFFQELFTKPIFVYPVTSLAFGCALHLIGSVERLTAAVLEQLLNVLKWLATLAGLILTLFTIALLFKLPSLVFAGQKAIGAAWLLWLVAVIVLLLNAAYRDGSVTRPYPRWVAQALRFVVPLTVIVSLTAIYALVVRTRHYGLTVERVWAFVVASAALSYAVGYSAAAFARGAWLAGIARINVLVAILLIVALAAALTPLLSPYRLAAESQYRMAIDKPLGAETEYLRDTPFHYLRFHAGRYGGERLQALAALKSSPNAEHIRELAQNALAQQDPWNYVRLIDTKDIIAKLPIYPAGRTLDEALSQRLASDLNKPDHRLAAKTAAGVYIDLNGDGIDEFVLVTESGGMAYRNQTTQWTSIGEIDSYVGASAWSALTSALAHGEVAATTPTWKDITIGTKTFRVQRTP